MTQFPIIKEITEIKTPQFEKVNLSNNIPVYIINKGSQPAIRLEIIFKAGRPFETKKLVSRVTNSIIKEGSKKYNAAKVDEIFDYYGASINTPINLDYSVLTVYCLTKHFETLLPIIREIIFTPAFLEKDFNRYIKNYINKLDLNNQKHDVVAYRKLTENIFGKNHPYGYNSSKELFNDLTIDDLKKHHSYNYQPKNCKIFISGLISDTEIKLMDRYLGDIQDSFPQRKIKMPPVEQVIKNDQIQLNNKNSFQASIRIGRKAFNRKHADYKDFYILNTILGGFFGSRLMTNIREDKGYTYNIFSTIDPLLHDGYFYIGAEVAPENIQKTIDEIHNEMQKLKEELIEPAGYDMVKNYLMGNMLSMVDGPFNINSLVRTFVCDEIPMEYFSLMIERILNITPEEIQNISQKYLNFNEMSHVTVQ